MECHTGSYKSGLSQSVRGRETNKATGPCIGNRRSRCDICDGSGISSRGGCVSVPPPPQPEQKLLAEREKKLAQREKALQIKEKQLELQTKLLKECRTRDNEYAKICEQLGIHAPHFRPATEQPSSYFKESRSIRPMTTSQLSTRPSQKRVHFSSDDSSQSLKQEYKAQCKARPNANRVERENKENNSNCTHVNTHTNTLTSIQSRLHRAEKKALRLRLAEINSRMTTAL